jgi:spermidine synthase
MTRGVMPGMNAELIGLSQEAAGAAELEQGVLKLLEREVGCDVAFFLVKGQEDAPTVSGLDEALTRRVADRADRYGRELLPVKHAALAARGVAVDTRVLGWERVRKLAYHREVAAKVGGRHSLMAYLPWRGQTVAAIMLGRTGSEFSDRVVQQVESLVPTLAVTRAAFGLPWVAGPLPPANEGPLRRWFGRGPQAAPLAEVALPNGTLRVRDRAGFREMVATEGSNELVWTRASLQRSSDSGWAYVELLHLAAVLAKQRRRALFIGCGGAVAMRQFASLYPGIEIDVVEREPAVVELARRWYALDTIPGLSVHVADGAELVARSRAAAWDIVVVDAYDADALAEGFAKRSFFAALRRVLRPGGAMAFNVIGSLQGDQAVSDIVRAVRRELRDVRIVPVVDAAERFDSTDRRNIVVVAVAF